MLSAILKPYAAFLLSGDKDLGSKVDLGEPLPVDSDVVSSLFGFITEVFVTFIRGVIGKLRSSIVDIDYHDHLLVLYMWRSLASLAKEVSRRSVQCCPSPTFFLEILNSYYMHERC